MHYLEDLEEIDGAYAIRQKKKLIQIRRRYQCGIAFYQLAKLRMLEFYYDFLDKYVQSRTKITWTTAKNDVVPDTSSNEQAI